MTTDSDRADAHWMMRAAALARRAEGWTSPNPLVGAVVVSGESCVGAGFHARAGTPHAEVLALQAAGSRAQGATLYVTLEPCAHQGRTPPCVDAIIASGIGRVVVGVQDPHPRVNGRGFAALAAAGIRMTAGVAERTCGELIVPYARALASGRPYVHLKLAMSADGRIAPAVGPSRWITGRAARRFTHRLRSRLDAVLVGIGTVLADDPTLTARLRRHNPAQPRPVVLDASARTPPHARLMRREGAEKAPLILCSRAAVPERIERLVKAGACVEAVEEDAPGSLRIRDVLARLAAHDVQSVLVEGGAQVAAAFVAAGVVDRATLLVAPVFLGGEATAALGSLGRRDLDSAPRGVIRMVRRMGADAVIEIDMGAS